MAGGQGRPVLGAWTPTVGAKQGGRKVCLPTNQAGVVLRHRGRCVAHQFRQGLEIDAVEGAAGAGAVPMDGGG